MRIIFIVILFFLLSNLFADTMTDYQQIFIFANEQAEERYDLKLELYKRDLTIQALELKVKEKDRFITGLLIISGLVLAALSIDLVVNYLE